MLCRLFLFSSILAPLLPINTSVPMLLCSLILYKVQGSGPQLYWLKRPVTWNTVLPQSGGGNWSRKWQPTPVLLPGKSHGWRSLVGYSPRGCEELDMTEQLHFHFSLSCIGEGKGNPLQYSCLENPRDGGAWRAAIYGVTQSRTRLKRLSSRGWKGWFRDDSSTGLHSRRTRGDRHFSRVEAKNPALLSNRDGYLLELTGWTQGSQAS